jgi:YfiH family protein
MIERFKDYLVYDSPKYKVVFSTAEDGKNFNRHTEDGQKTLEGLKDEFNVDDVLYLRQVHSDRVVIDNNIDRDKLLETEADSIITTKRNVATGVFTADCVPIILIDQKKMVCSAIHSGWKGTFNSITKKTIKSLKQNYGSDAKDIKVFIGAHIRKCCYEVSEELKEKFCLEKSIERDTLFNGRNLNLEACILQDLLEEGISEDNIISLNYCTNCSNEIKLHSYRNSNGDYGRLFSFIILK